MFISETVDDSIDEPVGFTAYASSQTECRIGDVVVFDQEVSNIGNHYNSTSGYFTCPVNGSYMFAVHIYSVTEDTINISIMLDDDNQIDVFTSYTDYDQASGQAIVPCAAGQLVWIRCSSVGPLYSSTRDIMSHFVGSLLQRY